MPPDCRLPGNEANRPGRRPLFSHSRLPSRHGAPSAPEGRRGIVKPPVSIYNPDGFTGPGPDAAAAVRRAFAPAARRPGKGKQVSKPYAAGMYGGKFLPYHKGHFYCLETASKMCDKVWQILTAGGVEEENFLREATPRDREMYSVRRRFQQMDAAGKRLGNVETLVIDISACRTPDGQEDWDAETPLILKACGKFDAVFGSEPAYAAYFSRAYPWADYFLVDPLRARYPISGTAIRSGKEAADKWTV